MTKTKTGAHGKDNTVMNSLNINISYKEILRIFMLRIQLMPYLIKTMEAYKMPNALNYISIENIYVGFSQLESYDG